MLDTSMLAAETGGLFGARPEPVGGVWAWVGANLGPLLAFLGSFLGFTFGTWFSHHLTARQEKQRRVSEQHATVAALIGELRGFYQLVDERGHSFSELLKRYPEQEVFGKEWLYAAITLPERDVWNTFLPRIGDLGHLGALSFSSMYGRFVGYDSFVKSTIAASADSGLTRNQLEDVTEHLDLLQDGIEKTVKHVTNLAAQGLLSYKLTPAQIQNLNLYFQTPEQVEQWLQARKVTIEPNQSPQESSQRDGRRPSR